MNEEVVLSKEQPAEKENPGCSQHPETVNCEEIPKRISENRVAALEKVKDLIQADGIVEQNSNDTDTVNSLASKVVDLVQTCDRFGSGNAGNVGDPGSVMKNGSEKGIGGSQTNTSNHDEGGPWTSVLTRSKAQVRYEMQKGGGHGLQPPHG
ncbi:hypothetical protein RIF29_15276 [Crotalaria pallida]|uniref:Uncharacterized protein n=1 Tax=Crotalaria pallida TaxID=3830 RepID=A0AAN9IJ14_CROPI